MMIDAEKALEIADAEARHLGWGGISSESYEAVPIMIDRRNAWRIDLKDVFSIGKRVRLLVDARTGEVIEKRRMGTR